MAPIALDTANEVAKERDVSERTAKRRMAQADADERNGDLTA
jgi:hypothetical protein